MTARVAPPSDADRHRARTCSTLTPDTVDSFASENVILLCQLAENPNLDGAAKRRLVDWAVRHVASVDPDEELAATAVLQTLGERGALDLRITDRPRLMDAAERMCGIERWRPMAFALRAIAEDRATPAEDLHRALALAKRHPAILPSFCEAVAAHANTDQRSLRWILEHDRSTRVWLAVARHPQTHADLEILRLLATSASSRVHAVLLSTPSGEPLPQRLHRYAQKFPGATAKTLSALPSDSVATLTRDDLLPLLMSDAPQVRRAALDLLPRLTPPQPLAPTRRPRT